MNDSRKWSAIRNMIDESACVAFCFQETKKAAWTSPFLKTPALDVLTNLSLFLRLEHLVGS
jgi:hypothetical protein